MVVTEDGEEYHAIYDMHPVSSVLRRGSVAQIDDTFSQCPGLYHDGMKDPPEHDDLTWHATPEQGSIGPLDAYTALSVASDTAKIVLDDGNWVDAAPETSNSTATSESKR